MSIHMKKQNSTTKPQANFALGGSCFLASVTGVETNTANKTVIRLNV